MRERKLLVVGDLNVDVLQEVGLEAGYGEERALRGLDFSIGGGAANLAVVAGRLGMSPVLISAIGKDFATKSLRSQISTSGVRPRLIESKKPNAYSIINVNKKGERSIQSASNCLDDITAKGIGKKVLPLIAPGDVIFFSGFFQLRKLRPGFKELLAKIKKRQAIVCLDTSFDMYGKWNISAFLPFIDYLFVNDVELRHITKAAKAEGSTPKARADYLMKKGAGMVVLKQGKKGATLFIKGVKGARGVKPLPFPVKPVKVKVRDTTGAGDAFNAGFVFGMMRDWSPYNCGLAGNFVASKKIQRHGLVAGLSTPTVKAVERFVAIQNRPMLMVEPDYSKMSMAAASIVASLLNKKPDLSIALPTGETPKQLYRILAQWCDKGKVSFRDAKLFAIDEYIGLTQSNQSSFTYFLKKNLLDKVDARSRNVFLMDGKASDLKRECTMHEAAIRKHGIDLCILGIAPNGHIGFNEPGSCPYSITRVVRLRPETRKKNAKDFPVSSPGMPGMPGSPSSQVPKKAITIGLKTIRENSRQILLLASGSQKKKAVSSLLNSKDFMKWPAVTLQRHRNVTVLADRAAAGQFR